MTVAGWVEIAALPRRAHGAHAGPRRLHGARVRRRASSLPRLRRAPAVPRCSAPSPAARARTGRPTRARCWCFSAVSFLVLYAILRTQTLHPFNPKDLGSGTWDLSFNTAASFVTNTNWQYYARRDDDVVLHADGRPRGAELRLRRCRHRGRGRRHPRLRARAPARRSATSGSTSRARCSTSCCRSRSSLALFFVSQGVLQTLGPTRRRHAAGGTDARARAGRLAGGDQAARHQRRRLLQRQLGDAVREPDLAQRTSSRCWRSSSSRPA